MKFWPIILSAMLVGCANPRPPTDVVLIPNDCANTQAITNWLVQQSQQPRSYLESLEQYEQRQSAVKTRLWNFRYNCQRL
jgi:hypothetical protein